MSTEEYRYHVGDEIRNYTLTEPLGKGGFSEVWKARDREHRRERYVALKLFDPKMMALPSVIERADNEANAQARLEKSPLVVTVLHVQLTEPPHFLAMMLMPGGTLASRLRKGAPMPIKEAVPLFRQIVQSLKVVHDEGLVHRDLKPSNILFERYAIRAASVEGPGYTDHGPLRLSDFGIVHDPASDITRFGYQLGTPAYMPPEQSVPGDGDRVTRATDIYAAGVILYEMLAGQKPIEGSSTTEVEVNRTLGNLTPLGARAAVPKPIERVVMKCLAAKAQYRYQTCDELLLAFDAAVAEAGIQTQTPLPGTPAVDPREHAVPVLAQLPSFAQTGSEGARRGPLLMVSALAVAALVGGAVYYALTANRSTSASSVGGNSPSTIEPAECAVRNAKTARYDDAILGRCTSPAWKQRAAYVDDLKSVANWSLVPPTDIRLMDCAGIAPCEKRADDLSRTPTPARAAAVPPAAPVTNPVPRPPAQTAAGDLQDPRVLPAKPAAGKACSYAQAEALMDRGGLYEDCSQASDPAFCESCWKALKMPRGVGPGPK